MKGMAVTVGRREGSLLLTPDERLLSFQSTFGAVTPPSLLFLLFCPFLGPLIRFLEPAKLPQCSLPFLLPRVLPQHAFLQPE